jgi:lambda family phage portal protein
MALEFLGMSLSRKKTQEPPPENKKTWKRNGVFKGISSSMFNAADHDPMNASWTTVPETISQTISKKWLALVARSREQISNNDYAKAYITETRKNVVGAKGVQLIVKGLLPDGSLDTDGNEAVELAWKEYCRRENCSVDGRLSWLNIQRLVINTLPGSGEVFLRKVSGRNAGPWGISLQILDPLRIPIKYDEKRLQNGNFIRQGIEMNPWGRVVAYYVQTSSLVNDSYQFAGRHYERVTADKILHIYDAEFCEQYRGIPWTASGLKRLRDVGGFEDAMIKNGRASASKGLVLEREHDYDLPDNEEPDLDTDDVELEPNGVMVIPYGYKKADYDPKFPDGAVASFLKYMLRGLASGFGLSYNSWANDAEGVTFGTLRQAKLDERDTWQDKQEFFIESLCQRVYEWWLEHSLLSGRIPDKRGRPIPATLYMRFRNAKWQPRRWAWLDPMKDEKALTEQVSQIRKSPGEAITESGRDPLDVWKAYAADIKAMRKAGIPDEKIDLFLFNSTQISTGLQDVEENE